MANESLRTKTIPQIITYISAYITEVEDGSQRVDESGLFSFLVEQFGYYTAFGGTSISQTDIARNIVNALKAKVNREAWTGDPAWPKVGTNSYEATRQRLRTLQLQMTEETKAVEEKYLAFEAGMTARLKGIFTAFVSGGFPTGVAREISGRSYAVTFVTDWGEESKPSPVTDVMELDQNDTVQITRPAYVAGRHITKWRLYRTAVGSQNASYMFHSEHDIATTVVVDDKPTEQLGETCPTFGWDEPLADLTGLVSMPNGILLGFTGDTLHACEPFHPYAWPATYDIPLDYPIVGLVTYGQSVFVGTEGTPYVVTGADSQSLAAHKVESNQACASRRSMVAIGGAVVYASPDGLCVFDGGVVSVVTASIFTKEDWQEYKPESMQGAEYEGRYYCTYTKADTTRGMLMFDYAAGHLSHLDADVDALFSDRVTDTLYGLSGTDILNLTPTTGTPMTGSFKTKVYRNPRPVSFGWIHADAEYPGEVTIKAYGDGALVHTATLTMDKPARFPAGKYTEWQFEVISNTRINSVTLCTSTSELSRV